MFAKVPVPRAEPAEPRPDGEEWHPGDCEGWCGRYTWVCTGPDPYKSEIQDDYTDFELCEDCIERSNHEI